MPENLSERNDDAAALTARLLRQVRRLEIRARHMAEDLFAGSYRSVFKGAGLEFSEVRRYYPATPSATLTGTLPRGRATRTSSVTWTSACSPSCWWWT